MNSRRNENLTTTTDVVHPGLRTMTPDPFLTMWTTEDDSIPAQYDVFLSHSARDKAVVSEPRRFLQRSSRPISVPP